MKSKGSLKRIRERTSDSGKYAISDLVCSLHLSDGVSTAIGMITDRLHQKMGDHIEFPKFCVMKITGAKPTKVGDKT